MDVRMVAALIATMAPGIATAQENPDVAPQPGPIAIYTRMTLAMRAEAIPPPLSYREVFEPSGLTLTVTKQSRAARRIALLFSPQARSTALAITEANGTEGITIRDETTNESYTGNSLFTSVTWAGIRQAPGVTTAGKVPVPQATGDAGGSAGLFDRAGSTLRSDVIAISDKSYRIAFVASEAIDDAPVYHLRLTPRSDPARHTIRDLYVDTTTYLVRRVTTEFKDEAYVSGYSGRLALDFSRISGYWLVSGGTLASKAHIFLQQFHGEARFSVRDVALVSGER